MPTVTDLAAQSRDPQRVNVYLDGEFAFGLSAEVVTQRGIRVGDVFGDDELRAIADHGQEFQGHAAVLNFLSFRPRTRREIEMYLRKRGHDPVAIERIVQRLLESGLLDDGAFARFWVESRQTFRPRGAMALRAEMRQKGIDSEVIEDALSDLPEEEGVAYAASEAKVRSLQNVEDREFYRRLLGFLQRRGFPYGVAATVARRRLTERNGSDEIGED